MSRQVLKIDLLFIICFLFIWPQTTGAQELFSTDSHLRKAATFLERKQWERAVDEYQLVLRHDEHNPAALFYRAYAYTHLRRYDLAKNDYNSILAKFPTHLEARLGLAYVCQQMGRKTDALNELNMVVLQHPDSVSGYVARASLETDMQQYEAACYDWEEVVRRKPEDTDYQLSYVDVLIRMGNKETAHRQLDRLASKGVGKGVLHEFYKKLR